MNLANKLTLLRLILAPVFFIVYLLPAQNSGNSLQIVVLLWIIFITSEITDMLDGMAARRLNQTSDFGKLFDPFADTLMQITCFLCFVIDNIFPAALFLIILYREFGILFIRNLMLKKGITMGARMSGKIKTVAFIIAAMAALFYTTLLRLDLAGSLQPFVKIAITGVFAVSVVCSVVSFIDYVFVYRREGK